MGKRVTVATMGEEVPAPIAFGDNADVNAVLEAFDVSLEKGETLAINGKAVNGTTIPKDGECVYIQSRSTGAI